MTTFVKKYVMGCDMCQQMKNRPQQPFGPLMPNKVPNGPWKIISMNLINQLPESNGYNAICVIVDRFTKRALSQTSFGYISINSLTILMVSMALESP